MSIDCPGGRLMLHRAGMELADERFIEFTLVRYDIPAQIDGGLMVADDLNKL